MELGNLCEGSDRSDGPSAYVIDVQKLKKVLSNTSKKLFQCSCDKSFHTKANLRQHARIHKDLNIENNHVHHTIDKSHKCNVCDKVFTKQAYVQRHVKSHLLKLPVIPRAKQAKNEKNVARFECSYCHKPFTRIGHLNGHIRVRHTGERPFSCEQCDKSYTQSNHLNEHMRIHHQITGDKSSNRVKAQVNISNCTMTKSEVSDNKPSFKCLSCERTFTHKGLLTEHKRVHTGDKFRCEFCDKSYTRRDYLSDHMRTHTGERPFICELCGKSFIRKGQLHKHLRIAHGVREIASDLKRGRRRLPNSIEKKREENVIISDVVSECDDIFEDNPLCNPIKSESNVIKVNSLNLVNSLSQSNESKSIEDLKIRNESQKAQTECDNTTNSPLLGNQCGFCGKLYKNKCHVYVHIRKAHPSNWLSYKLTEFAKKASVRASNTSLCTLKNNSDTSLSSKNVRKYKCDECERKFTRLSSLKTHALVHSGEKPFSCELCGKAYRQRSHLYEHLRAHRRRKMSEMPNGRPNLQVSSVNDVSDMTQIICDVCHATFARRTYLKVHMRVHTGEKPFQCDECPRKFRQRNHLLEHKRIHDNIRPFCCHTCDKAFRKRDALKNHLLMHTGARPYSCTICQMNFTRMFQLKKHMKSHHHVIGTEAETEAKTLETISQTKSCQFLCKICAMGFDTRSDLKVHTRGHNVANGFDCNACGVSFKRKFNLKKHLNIRHSKILNGVTTLVEGAKEDEKTNEKN